MRTAAQSTIEEIERLLGAYERFASGLGEEPDLPWINDPKLAAAVSDVRRMRPISATRENVVRVALGLPPITVRTYETISPVDPRDDVRPRISQDLHDRVLCHYGSVREALEYLLQWDGEL